MAGYIIKYTAGTYQRKIDTLKGYYTTLGTHLGELEKYKEQLKDFWDGSSADYMQLLGEKVREVKSRMNDCNNTILQYEKVVADMGNAKSTVDEAVSDAAGAAKTVAEVAGTAAKIAALL